MYRRIHATYASSVRRPPFSRLMRAAGRRLGGSPTCWSDSSLRFDPGLSPLPSPRLFGSSTDFQGVWCGTCGRPQRGGVSRLAAVKHPRAVTSSAIGVGMHPPTWELAVIPLGNDIVRGVSRND